MSTAEPAEIVVVIPWGGEQLDLLLAQIDCLTMQDVDEPLEIRIAANRPLFPEIAQALSTRSAPGRTVRVIDASSRQGPAHARNRGAEPFGSLILFCDADDEAHPSWAREMTSVLRLGADVVGGVLDYAPLNPVPFALSRTMQLPVAFRHLTFTPSASLGIKGSVFTDLGGFDEYLTSGEDIDLCWRAQYAGFTIAFAPGARMSYRLRQTWGQLFDQGRRYGISDLQLYSRHRVHGMTRTPKDTLGELVRVLALGLLALLGTANRLKFAVKLGTVVGHIEGSYRTRTAFI